MRAWCGISHNPSSGEHEGPVRVRRHGFAQGIRILDLPDLFGERLAHFPCLSLEGDGALEAGRCMPADRVIEPADGSGGGVFDVLAGLPGDRPDQFRLDGLEDRLNHRVVIAVPGPAHRDQEAPFSE